MGVQDAPAFLADCFAHVLLNQSRAETFFLMRLQPMAVCTQGFQICWPIILSVLVHVVNIQLAGMFWDKATAFAVLFLVLNPRFSLTSRATIVPQSGAICTPILELHVVIVTELAYRSHTRCLVSYKNC